MHQLFIQEFHRKMFEEYFPRLEKCLDQLSEEEIWYKHNLNSNSVGNLVLHLCGNVTQWIGSGLGNKEDNRNRPLEFEHPGPLPSTELKARLNTVKELCIDVLNKTTREDITNIHNVQIYQESGLSILIHVIEHFSYHLGQITYYTKWRKNMDMKYYDGV